MNDTNTSDEAFWEWNDKNGERWKMDQSFDWHALDGWKESARRSQARYDEALKCWSESIDEKNKEMEERERKALAFGVYHGPDDDRLLTEEMVEEVYRAFKEPDKDASAPISEQKDP